MAGRRSRAFDILHDVERDAILSACGKFRYNLMRRWGPGALLVFIMLNPSKADASIDDPTVRKCIGFAQRMGYDGIMVVNLFAFRATDPADLKAAGYPIGEANDTFIEQCCYLRTVVLAWGANARGHEQADRIWTMAKVNAIQVLALRLLSDGTPEHPLMLPYSCIPVQL